MIAGKSSYPANMRDSDGHGVAVTHTLRNVNLPRAAEQTTRRSGGASCSTSSSMCVRDARHYEKYPL